MVSLKSASGCDECYSNDSFGSENSNTSGANGGSNTFESRRDDCINSCDTKIMTKETMLSSKTISDYNNMHDDWTKKNLRRVEKIGTNKFGPTRHPIIMERYRVKFNGKALWHFDFQSL